MEKTKYLHHDKANYLLENCIRQSKFNETELFNNKYDDIAKFSEQIIGPETYGLFYNDSHYLQSVDLLIKASLETEHRDKKLFCDIVPHLYSYTNFLDIGVGNGVLTKLIGQVFENITIVDNSPVSLANVKQSDFPSTTQINKIEASITNLTITDTKYDLIFFSHIIYYIPIEERNALVDRLYGYLNDYGLLVIIYNAGLSRYDLTRNFGGKNFNFTEVAAHIEAKYTRIEHLQSKEFIRTPDIESMLHIAGVCLKDSDTTATKQNLEDYLHKNHYYNDNFYIDMMQNFYFIWQSEYDH